MVILVVDDNELSRGVLEKILKISGYEVVSASNGEEAMKLAQERRPDLVISDIMMPYSDGYEFCRNMRMDPGLKEVPFIFYSAAFTSPKDVDFAFDLGATKFIQKPQDPKSILKAVEELLSGQTPGPAIKTGSDTLHEQAFLKKRSERVVQKLEEKVAELEKTQAFLETVLDSMAEGLVVIDMDYTVLDANYAACKLLKMSKEDILGKRCHSLYHGVENPCSPATAICPFGPVFNEAGPMETTYTHTIPCQGHVLEVVASPIRNSSGEITSIVQIIRDVTERVKLEEEINARIKELEDFYDASVAKQMRLIELEKEVKTLRELLPKQKDSLNKSS